MSSMLRNIQRRALRKRSDYESAPQPTIIRSSGYFTLHPTKGWRWISEVRLAAQRAIAAIIANDFGPRRRKPSKVWRKPAPVPPSVETRQQRRAAARGYRAV